MNELLKLKNICSTCVKCELSSSRNQVVFGKGNSNASIMFIGEAPGEKEDLQGLPFVGRAGSELDKLLKGIGLGIEDVYIANILKCRPPKNRNPSREEIELCTPYLIEQITLIKPKIIASLGNYSTKFVLSGFNPKKMSKIQGISDLHGKPQNLKISGLDFTIIPLYHPAAMLYRPKLRVSLEEDFKVMEKIIFGRNSRRETQKILS